MSACADFQAMRADLVARGLLTADFAITEAGVAYVEATIAELDAADEPVECGYVPIRWQTRGGPR